MHTIPLTEWSDEQILEEVRKLRVGYQLKRTLRYATKRDFTVHNESVAEHKFGLFFLADYFLPLEDPEGKLDYRTVHRIILYHDFPEIPGGDIPYLWKTDVDEERERIAAKDVFASLPQSIGTHAYASWLAYEERDIRAAQFGYALDKIEPMFELFDPVNEQSCMRLRQTYESHIGKKLAATETFPCMRRFVEVMSADMQKRGVFWKET